MEWLLDHYTSLVGQVAETSEALSGRAYRALTRTEARHRFRVRRVARELADSAVDSLVTGDRPVRLDADTIAARYERAQAVEGAFSLIELWAIRPFLKLALFERLDAALDTTDLNSPECVATAQAVIENLHVLDDLSWRDLTESLSAVDAVLRLDPSGVYARMDFETRDEYRRAVQRIGIGSRLDEDEIARFAVELASEAMPGDLCGGDHVGYYLVGDGTSRLEHRAGYRPPLPVRLRYLVERHPSLFYVGGIGVAALALATTAAARLHLGVVLALLVLLPATQAAVEIVNRLVHAAWRPRRLPRLDFSSGVPDDCRAFIVVPTLLLSESHLDELVDRLEIHYLANRDANLRFALLTDGPDADAPHTGHDDLANRCRGRIRELNDRYAADGGRPFYLFHRERTWNAGESAWMGHERKRGKLNDFNCLLLGGPDVFATREGDSAALQDVRFVITLDSDTQLPRDAARALIGTAAHPLNRPVLDPDTGLVRHGYGILQPRVSVSLESAERSRFAQFQSGAAGLDPYVTAVSDVYQDLYGQATFTGKGLYDLAAFHAALDGRFPDNTLLSHDLIEGEHARVGLVTDVELIDDYPASYETYSKREHRWIRGDWQIASWLLPHVPDGSGGRTTNPLPFVSRWKIADNLRRSLLSLSLLAFVVVGWWADKAFACTVAAIMLFCAGTYVDLILSVVDLPPRRLLRSSQQMTLARAARRHLDAVAALVFLPHQALVAADAVVRTLIRRFVTRRHLLEWESMAQADSAAGRGAKASLVRRYLSLTPVVAIVAACMGWMMTGHASFVALATAAVWVACPWIARWADGPAAVRTPMPARDTAFLRDLALQTWRFFVDWSRPETNWLVPDHVNDASGLIADRASPTNIGLQLGSTLAAHDFGYLTHRELARRLTSVLDTIDALEHYRGHLYNWYDTRTLQTLAPRYVSAVDSGNLCAALVTIKHGCLEALDQPLVDARLLQGLSDCCVRLRKSLPRRLRTPSMRRQVARLLHRLEATPADLSGWTRTLVDARVLAVSLANQVTDAGTPTRRRSGTDEARYWAAMLLDRIDTLAAEVRRFAPFAEGLLPAGARIAAPQGPGSGGGRVPTLATCNAYYDDLEHAARALMQTGEASPSTARRLGRLLEETAAARAAAHDIVGDLQRIAERASRLVEATDFQFLFDERRNLLRIGYDADVDALDQAHYGLLASEARTAVFLAIAKHDLPREAWFRLGRTLTLSGEHRTLLSWTGSMFEYLMPALFMRSHESTLLGTSVKRAVQIQQAYGRERHVPWGISEAAYGRSAQTRAHRYQPFGVPALATKRIPPNDLVIAPYATFLALMTDPAGAVRNLRTMVFRGWTGRCGLFESIDYRARATGRAARPSVVPLFMAHHVGMSLLALDNVLVDGAMQRRFHAEPLVAAVELLLQERMPALVPDADVAVPSPAAVAPSHEPADATAPADAMVPPQESVLPAS